MSAREIYEANIRQLSPLERLQLASMILDDLTASKGAGLDISDEWSEQDVADLAAASLKYSQQSTEFEGPDA